MIGCSGTVYAASGTAKTYTVTYYSNDGKTKIKTVNIDKKGKVISTPARRNPEGYTFMGWSSQPKCTKDPEYEPKQKFEVKKSMKLYEVLYKIKKEPNVTPEIFYNNRKYGKIIFIGDSRTNGMHDALKENGSAKTLKNVQFIAKNGRGLSWFQNEGKNELIKSIPSSASKPTAVVINLGINDLKHNDDREIYWKDVAYKYVRYFNALAENLKSKNCDLYYMSLNPVNCAHSVMRHEYEIRNFNSTIKEKLPRYKYIDSYSYLIKTGYTTGQPNKRDDGVHFTERTYKRIYNYCINKICK